jgi:membrane associated rhomboid family serine protease
MDFLSTIKQSFKSGNAVIRLIYVNVAVYVAYYLIHLIFTLFNLPVVDISSYLAVSSGIPDLLQKPWTLVTYMFFHEGFFHILFNMFALYWFGKLFLMYFNQKQATAIYFIGGIAGALIYILSFNIFPYFVLHYPSVLLLGASGSIMAIITAVAFYAPNMEMQMLFFGRVKLKWIALFFILTSFFGITSNNAGGELAHLGGALTGYLFVVSLRKGRDLTKGLNRLFDAVINLFSGRKLRVVKNKKSNKKMNDAEYNRYKAKNLEEIDRILDKIKSSGYESLSAEEKRKLFEQKK